ncbi:hypothetical protein BD413DRAFT_498216 [Trametes elegans]|nr:hypothetical protein BD413DRAFT_498216 [Trametes elegans]
MAVEQAKPSVDGNLAATYSHIYSFLLKKEHTKAAEALKKAVKNVVVLKDGVGPEGPSLDQIVKEWKELKAKAAVAKKSSDSSDSESEAESSSAESSSDPSSDSSDDDDSDEDSSDASSSSSGSSSKAKSSRFLPSLDPASAGAELIARSQEVSSCQGCLSENREGKSRLPEGRKGKGRFPSPVQQDALQRRL